MAIFGGEIDPPRHSGISASWLFVGRMLVRQEPTTPLPAPLLVWGGLFGEHNPTLFTAKIGLVIVPTPTTRERSGWHTALLSSGLQLPTSITRR